MSRATGSSASRMAGASSRRSVMTTASPIPWAIGTAGSCRRPPPTMRTASGVAANILSPLRVDLRDRTHVEPHVQDLAVHAGHDGVVAEGQDQGVAIPDHDHVVDRLQRAEQTGPALEPPPSPG